MNPPKRKKADPFVQKEKTRHVERSQCKCKSDVRRPSIPLSVREGEEGRRRDGIRWGCLPLSSRVSRGAFTPRWKAPHGEGGVVGKRVDNRGCTPFPPPTGTLSTRGNRLGSLCLPIPPAFSTPSPSFLLLLNFPLHLNFWSCFFSLSLLQ